MVDTMNINEVLCAIQSELNIEKKRKNLHYDYSYRNAEDIMAGIKPCLKKYRVGLSLGQDIKEVGGCIFLQIILSMRYQNDEIKNNYFCPIQAPSKQGQSISQAFGATISYANKYALASMFLLDEGIDSDSMNQGQKSVLSHPHIYKNTIQNNAQFNPYAGMNMPNNRISIKNEIKETIGDTL